MLPTTNHSATLLAQRLASRFRMLNVAWIILTIMLGLSAVGLIAAAWNFYVFMSRRHIPRLIDERRAAVLGLYHDDIGWFIMFFLINLILGGGIGALLIAYEFFFIRNKVLANRHIFTQ